MNGRVHLTWISQFTYSHEVNLEIKRYFPKTLWSRTGSRKMARLINHNINQRVGSYNYHHKHVCKHMSYICDFFYNCDFFKMSGLPFWSESRVPSVPYSHFFQTQSHFYGRARADSEDVKILISKKLEKRLQVALGSYDYWLRHW